MNKNKLIFAIIGAVLLIFVVIGVLLLQSDTKKTTTVQKASGSFKIWIVADSQKGFEEFISTFKDANRGVADVAYEVVSFPDYEEYSRALNSAMIKGEAPDIFVLNNNEVSLFEEKVLPIPGSVINVTDFRKNYKGIFNDDLIVSNGETNTNGDKVEFLKGLPVGYETLGIFYNRSFRFKISDFNSIASLNSAIEKVKRMNVIPLGMGNGTTVVDAPDILSQFFLLHKVDNLADANQIKMKQALGEYTGFGTINGENAYNTLYADAKVTGKSNIDLFIEREVAAIIAYPRAILKLQAGGFSKRNLFAAPFPHFHGGDGGSLANYNYFAINADSTQSEVAFTLLEYLNSDEGAAAYLEKYRYYLPARLSLEDEMEERKVSNYFENIVVADFYSDEPLSSFNKGSKVIFDRDVIPVLDDFASYLSGFNSFKASTLCKADKILNLSNLGESCDK